MMKRDNRAAVRDLLHAVELPDSTTQPATNRPVEVPEQSSRAASNLIPKEPSSRLIYLDEGAMHAIALQLLNDPRQLQILRDRKGNDEKVNLDTINDAQMVNAAYFAKCIWRLPPNETLMDIPPQHDRDGTFCSELYPGALVRVRAIVKSAQDLRTDRVTLTSTRDERIHVAVTNHGVLSRDRKFMVGRVLYVVGRLSRRNPLSLTAAAVLLARR